MLTFLNSSALWGLLAVSIPIIIHLFNLRRVKRVEFSNIALLKKVKEETSARKKPIELLILLARMLFVVFLVLAFAQLTSKEEDNAPELNDKVLIYVDNSLSMQRPVGGQSSAFDQAFAYANAIVDAYPDHTKYKFIENSYGNSLMVNYSEETIKDRLTELDFSSINRSLPEIYQRLINTDFQGDVYFISDYQKGKSESLTALSADTARTYYLVPIDTEESGNLYFDSAYLENSFLLGELTNELKVLVRNDGGQMMNGVNLRLFFGNQLSGTALLDLPANSSVLHSFEIDRDANGLNEARLELEDALVDFDNELYLTLNNIEKINVFEIRSRNSGNYVSRLFGDNELFNFLSFNPGDMDLNQLGNADLIILNELNAFSNQLISTVNDFVGENGSVLVIPSGNLAAADYGDLNINATHDSGERVPLAGPDFQNPFFDGVFEERDQAISMPDATTSLRLRNEEYSLLEFKNGRSFLSKVESEGNLYFFASSFESSQTGFPNHSIFVPVMYKIALGSKANLSKLYYATTDETIVYPLEYPGSGIVNLASGEEVTTPDQRYAGGNLILEIPKDEITPGHFEIRSGGRPFGTLAFNLPTSESSALRYTSEELAELSAANHIHLIDAHDAFSAGRAITAGVKGVSLWKYALVLALLFLFVEIILIRYL